MEKQEPEVAVALKYDAAQDNAPRVVATGRGHLAAKIKELGEQSGVPLYRDPALAQTLANLDLGAEIPVELYQIVAEVLFFVHRLNTKAPGAWQRD